MPDILAEKFSILVKINKAVSSTLDLNTSFLETLDILQESYDVKSGAIFLFDEDNKYLKIAASVGYDVNTKKTKYKPGKGLTGQIAESGKPIVVPQVSKEPQFLNRLSSWDPDSDEEQSFIGVPIISDYTTLGALVISLPYNEKRDYVIEKQFLTLVASSLLQQISLRKEMESERQKLKNENVVLRYKLQEEHNFKNIIGNSNAMQEMYEQIIQVTNSNTTVLIRGESGTGKELVARAIHFNSSRSENSFVKVNCAAIPENLIESEFFGHEKGAFTGALTQKKGRFELSDKGTIFLDEIGDLSPMTQVKLLRVLQEKEFDRVGGTKTIKVNTRVIAATNADLEKLLEKGVFREDLYYRLNVFSINIPPLRDRKTDILLLADHFMLKYARQQNKSIRRISTPAIDMLMSYHWPGNVRELENCIERATLVCNDNVIHSFNLPPSLQTAESSDTIKHISLKESVSTFEKELIQDMLKTTKGNKVKAARMLNSTERIFGYKIKTYGIDVSRYKNSADTK
ncbi:MAG: GAF domain-containing protein [Calditrichaeota bacterium]|nr:MAG: GAF domain-containing protein [Calditrichota bacterium]MBL1205634.1 GAF domain-containing protein [Calditrichota bacterium]NOG45462.1 sigma 54-interacting transcriptional regulator [Calditrichota bacterium]